MEALIHKVKRCLRGELYRLNEKQKLIVISKVSVESKRRRFVRTEKAIEELSADLKKINEVLEAGDNTDEFEESMREKYSHLVGLGLDWYLIDPED